MMTSFLLGFVALAAFSFPAASECKNGNAIMAPLACRNLRRVKFIDSLLASWIG
jgi:hypothetical protein